MFISQWRYVHLLFFVAFLGSWFLFALLWWLIIYYHGDFEEEHLPENQVSPPISPIFLISLSHYLTTLTILTLTYPVADLHIAIDMFCNQHLSPLPGSKQLDAMRLANQQLCFCLPFQVTIPTKALLRNKQTQ